METKENSEPDQPLSRTELRPAENDPDTTSPTLLSKVKGILAEPAYKNLALSSHTLRPQPGTDSEVKKRLKKENREMKKTVFGFELVLDLAECDLEVMSSKKKLEEYCDRLCKLIKMKKYGKTQLPYFGLDKPHTKGYSLLQFIETSSITGHFSEYWKRSYINIFSCKPYDHKLATKFTREFFRAKHVRARLLVR